MGRGQEKKLTLVIDLMTGLKTKCESRFEACKLTGIKRKSINAYINNGTTFKKRYKFKDIHI